MMVTKVITITLLAAFHLTESSGLNYGSYKNLAETERGNNLEEIDVNIPWTPTLFDNRHAKRFFWSKPTKDSKNRYKINIQVVESCHPFLLRRYGMWITAINKEPANRVRRDRSTEFNNKINCQAQVEDPIPCLNSRTDERTLWLLELLTEPKTHKPNSFDCGWL